MGLTQYGEFIYWTDTEAKTIQRAHKTTGQNFSVIQEGVELPMDIAVIHASRQSGK
jgi:low density lipoprotein receptor-related protein 5/6